MFTSLINVNDCRCNCCIKLTFDPTCVDWLLVTPCDRPFAAVFFSSSDGLLDDFLSACCGGSSPQKAVELVQMSAAFGLPATARLAKRTLAEFQVTEEQR